MLGNLLQNLGEKRPLIHSITNYVTANDCANLLLACGASPIMADDPGEVEEITALCDGLVLNLGTLSQQRIPALVAAGRAANALGKPVVLDPVGVGASKMRTQTALELMEKVKFAAIRGNLSEMKTLAQGGGQTRGVDAQQEDAITGGNLHQTLDFARAFSQRTGAIIAITGATDLVAAGQQGCTIGNGHPFMARITGTGCQLSCLVAAILAANPEQRMESVVAALCAMGLCGQRAVARLGPQEGNATCRNYIIDAICRLTPAELEEGAIYAMQ